MFKEAEFKRMIYVLILDFTLFINYWSILIKCMIWFL